MSQLSDIEHRIYSEKIRLMYNQAISLVAGGTLCALAITIFLWTDLPHQTLIYWLGAVGASAVLRLWGVYAYLKADQQSRREPMWGTVFWMGELVAGIAWSTWPLLFYSVYSVEYLLIMSAVFAGIVAASTASGGIYMPAFIAFSVPLLAPLSLAHMFSGHNTLVVTGALLMMFLAFNIILAFRINRQHRELLCSQLENRKLMENLSEERRIAERAMAAKSHFLAAASHDLRQPLHAMGLFLGALRNRESDADKIKIIEDMSKSTEALNSLFSSLLDVSRLDAEIIDFNPEHVPADRLFDALRAQFEQRATEKNIELRIGQENHVLYCDKVLLERVLRNLLSNAIRYTQSGFVSLHCQDNRDDSKQITILDTGIGIPGEFAEDVFSEYFQLNNPSRDRKKGLGLGLAIVRRLCDLMDLPLKMQSEEGKGTAFDVFVPAGDPTRIIDAGIASTCNMTEGCRVLVIDDEPQVLQSMRQLLDGWGCNVMLAESARDAVKIIAVNNVVPDIIISDYRLANHLNGVDAVAAVRESVDAPIHAIIVGGDTSADTLKEVRDAGLQLLHKPVSPDELNKVIQALSADINSVVDQEDNQWRSVVFKSAGGP